MLAASPRRRFYLAAGLFLLLWSGCCILSDSQLLWGVYRQTIALRYPRVPGKVIVSEVSVEPGDEGPVHQVAFEFAYSVAGQHYTSDQCRYGPDRHSPQRVEALPAGTDVDVYYNPDNPGDACLYPGPDGSDLFRLMFLTPFNIIMVVGWLALFQDRRQRRQRGWIGAIREEDLRTRIRLDGFPASLAGILTAAASAIVLYFVVAFAFGGGFRAGLEIMSGAWGLIVVASLTVTADTARRDRSGVRHVIIDNASNTITLPPGQGRMEAVTIPFEALKAVEIERRMNPKSYPEQSFFPMLIFAAPDGRIQGERLTKRSDEAEAENLTNWFRQRLRLNARQPALVYSVSRSPGAATLAASGIHKTEDAGRLHLIWNNRHVPKDNLLFWSFVLFWIVWAPVTCFMTLAIFFSGDPIFPALWCIFGWLGTVGIPYTILRSFQVEWIEISREGISHGFSGWLAGKPKSFRLDSVVELELGRHESNVTINIRRVRFPQRHMLGYWLAPATKEQVFEAIHEFRQANWLQIPFRMTRYGV